MEFGQAAEAAGFDSIWTVEHVVYPDDYTSEYPYDPSGKMAMTPDSPLPDPLIWLTWVASATTTLGLGTGILILPQRNPWVLAKSLGTLDSMSGGRVILGVGVGWLKEEFEALGIPSSGEASAPTTTSGHAGLVGQRQHVVRQRPCLVLPGSA